MANAKFVSITDAHNKEGPNDGPWTLFSQNEYRITSTAQKRIVAAAETAEAQGVDFLIVRGDAIDSNTTNGVKRLSEIFYESGGWAASNFSSDIYDEIGNQENTEFASNWSSYANNVSRGPTVNTWADGGINKAYSFDNNLIHYIVLYTGVINDTGNTCSLQSGGGQSNWLDSDLAASSLPKIIFSHLHISEQKTAGAAFDYINHIRAANVRAVIEADGDVQAVIQGHYHTADISPTWISDVLYIHERGSVLADNEEDIDTNAYSLYEVVPNAVMGVSRERCNMKITGYGESTSKDFEKYL